MIEYLWDGEMDCGWEDLGKKVKNTSSEFRDKMLEIVDCSPNIETRDLISPETMDRFLNLATLMSENLEKGFYYQSEDLEPNQDNAYKLNLWIVLGSLTECALQIFLSFYIEDYKKSKWQQWEEINIDEVKNPIISTINDLISDCTITSEQGRTLKKTIKNKLKEHTVEHPIQRVMLDEIINYYESMKLLDEDELFYLKAIQSSRNGIHSFESRTIGTWMDLQYSVRFFCYLLEWILQRLPDVSDC